MKDYAHILAAVHGRPWYIEPDALAAIAEIVRLHASGVGPSHAEIEARIAAAAAAHGPRRGSRTSGAVAVIPIYGPIFPRATMMTEFSGGATIAGLRTAFREALDDESVGAILLDVDSPGGRTDGVEEFAEELRESRGRKPIVAIADYAMASAAYYLASQADEVVASPSAMVGWIGTAMIHQETSRHDEADGVTTTIIRNPPGKLGGNSLEPLSDQTRAELQAIVDELTGQFHAAVAKGRGVPVSKVKADFGQGGGMSASAAKAAGLVDRVEAFEDTVRRLAAGRVPFPRGAVAATDGIGAVAASAEVTHDEPSPDLTTEAAAALAIARARAQR